MLGPEFLTRPRLSRIYYRGGSSTTRCGRRMCSAGSAWSSPSAARSHTSTGAGGCAGIRPETFEEWVVAGSGGGCTTRSSARTPRRCGVSLAPRSRRSGRRSESRISASRTRSRHPGVRRGRPRHADRGVPLPAAGPGQMWEAFRDRRRGAWCPRAAQSPLRRAFGTRPARRERVVSRRRQTSANTRSTRCCRASHCRSCSRRSTRRRRRVRRPRVGCGTANLCLVALMTDEPEPFPDNWIYIHDPRRAPGAYRTSAPGAPTWSVRRHLPRRRVLLLRG